MTTTYAARNAAEAASRARLQEVLTLGESRGLFKVTGTQAYEGDTGAGWHWAYVTTPEGLQFSFTAGGWNQQNKIGARVHSVERRGGSSVSPRDVLPYGQTSPEAMASSERPAEVILKDLCRRVIQNPEAVAIAKAIKDTAEQIDGAAAVLAEHVKVLEGLGYRFAHHKVGEAYSADGYSTNQNNPARSVKVYATGRVVFETSVPVENMAEVLGSLTKARAAPY